MKKATQVGAATPTVAEHVRAVSKACSVLAKSYFESGFNVAVDHVFYPGEFENDWKPHLEDCRCAFTIVRPDLRTTLSRGASRGKHVREDIVRDQHERTGAWPREYVVDTSELSIDQGLEKVTSVLAKTAIAIRGTGRDEGK